LLRSSATHDDCGRHFKAYRVSLRVTYDTGAHTADDFATFLRTRLIRASTMTTPSYDVPSRSTPTLDNGTPVTTDELEKLIGSAPCKTCQLHPAPTWLVKNMKTLLSPFVTLLFNKSLAVGCVPSDFKKAVVRPLLKKAARHQPDKELPTCFERVIGESCAVFAYHT